MEFTSADCNVNTSHNSSFPEWTFYCIGDHVCMYCLHMSDL